MRAQEEHSTQSPPQDSDFFPELDRVIRQEQEPNYIGSVQGRFGAPGFSNKSGKLSRLNEAFWAGLCAVETVTIYEPNERQFYRYNSKNGLYEPITEDKLHAEFERRIYEASISWGPAWFPLRLFRTRTNLKAIIGHLKGQVERRDVFHCRPRIVHCKNCVLRFDSAGAFNTEPFSPEHFSRNASPYDYDPGATCPKFLELILGHLSAYDTEMLQKAAGLCLLGRNIVQKFFVLDGVAGASKGAFLEVLKLVIGEENCGELRTEVLMERFEIARVANKSLLLGADVPGNFLSTPSAHRIKSMVGGDLLDCEIKGSMTTFSIRGQFNILVTANIRLRVRIDGDRSAWKRGLVIVRYDQPYRGREIPEIAKLIAAEEGSGILNWCIQGVSLLLNDIRRSGNLVLSEAQEKRVENLLNESDSIRIFLMHSIKRADQPDKSLTVRKIIGAYNKFCLERGWDPIAVSIVERQLPDLMSELFGVLKSHDFLGGEEGYFARGFHGIEFRSGNDET
jgi:phage/plasmid-associated DNA primase